MTTADILNKHVAETDGLGVIRLKINSLIQSTDIDNETSYALIYLNGALSLNLTEANNREEHIDDYIPGKSILEVFEGLNTDIANPYIKALIYDILQVNKKNKFHNAQLAIASYLSLCKNKNSLSEQRDFILRVIEILKGLGRGNKGIMPPIFDKIKADILKADIFDECYSVTHIIKATIGLEAEKAAYEDYVVLLQNNSAKMWSLSKFDYYRYCNDTLARLLPEKSIQYAKEIALGYIAEAEDLSQTPNISQHLVADRYKKALRIFSELGLKGDEVDNLAKRLASAQQKAVLQIQSLGSLRSEPLKNNSLLEFPEFENVYQAVFWLIEIDLPSLDRIEQEFNNKKQGFLHQYFLGATMADAKGNIIGMSGDNAKQIYIDAKLTREIYCKTIIVPMYDHFRNNITISEMELNALLYNSKFIPPDRLSIYTRGLFHGFCGNFVEAVHLLVPQIENGLKTILNDQGKITRKLNQDIQNERNLQYFLDQLKNVLNKDLIFDLDGLLNEAFGENLRHNLAHGLCETAKLESYIGLYAWWLSLKLSLHIDKLMVPK